MREGLLLVMVLGVVGCGVQDAVVDGADRPETVAGPLLGEGGLDAADRSCHVVLRSADRLPWQGGYVTHCTPSAGCFVVWTGVVDVSAQAAAEGARPFVLYKNLDAQSWSRQAAVPGPGAPAGFERYTFRLERDTLRDGISFSSLQHARVELIPYLLTASGARLFDHNRRAGDFDVYPLEAATGWRVGEDATACPPRPAVLPSIDFQAGWRQVQRGALVAGQRAVLRYALDRLPTCRGTHNGYPAWDVRAFVQLEPSGQIVDGTVRGFDAPGGTPSNASAVAVPLELELPAGTTGVQIWFKNFTGAGSTCEAYDSNLGANYHFPVEPRPLAPAAWVGNPGSSFSRACTRTSGAPASVVLDSYLAERACLFVEADVYVPGLTDVAIRPEAVYAQAELSLDGQPLPAEDLAFVERVGNDYRYRYQLPRAALFAGPRWRTLEYTLRFSTDGSTWLRDVTRTVTRDPSFCNPAWASCAP